MQKIHLVEQINCLEEELLQTNNENYSLKKSNVLLTGENLENKNKLKDSKVWEVKRKNYNIDTL